MFEDTFDANNKDIDDAIDVWGLENVQVFDRVGSALVPRWSFIIARGRGSGFSKPKQPTGEPRGRKRQPFRLQCDDLWRRRKTVSEARTVMLRWARDPANNYEVRGNGWNVVGNVDRIYKKNDELEREGKMQRNPPNEINLE